jgi:hypothetical protein
VRQLAPEVTRALERLRADLESTFTERLEAVVVYGPHAMPDAFRGPRRDDHLIHTLALVSSLDFADLSQSAARVESWRQLGLAVPLLLTRREFVRSLDTFPLEYGDIIARHVVVTGSDPFAGLTVAAEDRRRACEVVAKSHVIHLREAYLETGEHASAVAGLIAASAEPFRRLLLSVTELFGPQPADPEALAQAIEARAGLSADVVRQITKIASSGQADPSEAILLYPPYLDAAHRLWQFVDNWKG